MKYNPQGLTGPQLAHLDGLQAGIKYRLDAIILLLRAINYKLPGALPVDLAIALAELNDK